MGKTTKPILVAVIAFVVASLAIWGFFYILTEQQKTDVTPVVDTCRDELAAYQKSLEDPDALLGSQEQHADPADVIQLEDNVATVLFEYVFTGGGDSVECLEREAGLNPDDREYHDNGSTLENDKYVMKGHADNLSITLEGK